MPSNRVALARPCHAPLPWAMTQRSGLENRSKEPIAHRKSSFAHSRRRELSAPPPAEMPLNSRQIFNRGEVVAGLPGRTISGRHLIALGTPRPGDARALIISGKRKSQERQARSLHRPIWAAARDVLRSVFLLQPGGEN